MHTITITMPYEEFLKLKEIAEHMTELAEHDAEQHGYKLPVKPIAPEDAAKSLLHYAIRDYLKDL
jgi:hypothetical protein